ncbi:hypothetical protein Kpol_526p38 [Vanderwaltozyma polyspora DSM 70294]|uniref:FAD-binding FR-type domain-containing protein n=1 Tax=Vanderwaltozyma polyspora (strain ATCC 22028 / DSM 70294 / BCRC 21397 / CBS 2163 / NBRC 10782 / NRRL Y-8283 / UCD 57-17) TaxID=436907 RepID=A7TLU3_VANPO|nr:uncharacterized protein Kpol_526p38 [Vanderwaltozyma polyspora DSM 70294]EDO16785.1 hypothetical protein Kpol_526p38 [Vanderwaltozyma polyspora DSM 70294]
MVLKGLLFKRFVSGSVVRRSGTVSNKVLFGVGAAALTASLGYFSYKFVYGNGDDELSLDKFTRYRVSYKKPIDGSHFLMELTPVVKQRTNLWLKLESEKLWSVEVKQPEIMVARNYTPLPLKYDAQSDDIVPLKDGDNAGGKLFFYLKQYPDGEVSRWLFKMKEGDQVELRGPITEYELPRDSDERKRDRGFLFDSKTIKNHDVETFRWRPFDISFYAAGTGIAPALQLTLSEDPFKGKLQLFYSCKQLEELGPLAKYLELLQQNGRIELNLYESSKGNSLRKDTKKLLDTIPAPSKYVPKATFKSNSNASIISPVLSLVCGPDEYISTIAGPKYLQAQGQTGGLLKQKGWNEENVYKLS